MNFCESVSNCRPRGAWPPDDGAAVALDNLVAAGGLFYSPENQTVFITP
jgi:hypothetical protein